MPKVSVVMPAYNGERFLREAIDSVLKQTFRDFEFIIVDDCSTDGTWEIIAAYAAQDSRIVPFRNIQNTGAGGARNAGLKLANGEYVAAMDADDVLLTNRLELQVKFLDTHPEVGLVAGSVRRIDANGNFLSLWSVPTEHDVLLAQLLFNNPFAQPTVMMRRVIMEQIGGYSDYFSRTGNDDYDMWWRMSRVTKLAAVPQVVSLIRITTEPSRLSFAQAPKQLLYSQEISLQIAREIMGTRPLDAEAYQRFFMCSRGRADSLIRFDVRRLHSLWDVLAADTTYRQVIGAKLLHIAFKLTTSQPIEAVSLLMLVNLQFQISWKKIFKKYTRDYLNKPLISFKRSFAKAPATRRRRARTMG
jgi:glycosyltransferase involved in cell wall biosynthesis